VLGDAWPSLIIVLAINSSRPHVEQFSTKRELVSAMTIGEQAIVANALKAIRQYVKEEATYELGDLEAHDFALVFATFPVMLTTEANVGLVEIDQAAIRDCDTMSVACEIG
jgi:hypothetical protein